MRDISGLRVCMSGDGQGEIARAIMAQLSSLGVVFVRDALDPFDTMMATQRGEVTVADVAICTTGGMLIRDAALVMPAEQRRLYEGNYLKPRCFTERHISAMGASATRGLIIHLGSNAATYGNASAEDYAAYKSALRKYCEIRRRTAREHGIRIAYIGFGGVATKFWEKATAGADPELTKTIVPGARQPLTAEEAASYVVSLILLPENITVCDSLVLSVGYQ